MDFTPDYSSMFYVRETPWHGFGTRVMEAPGSEEALEVAGLNWMVRQEPIYTDNNLLIPGYKANVRDSDNRVLGVVTDRYKVVPVSYTHLTLPTSLSV